MPEEASMFRKYLLRTAALLAGGLLALPAAWSAEALPDEAKDLTAVLALLGKPCGQVVKVVSRGENDLVATCQDGTVYRVFVNAEGRVVAEATAGR
jgi:hypothetical protein